MTTWYDIEIVIPTVQPTRRASLLSLIAQLAEQCPAASIRIEIHKSGDPPSARAQRCFGKHKHGEWILYIEDDVFLSPDFGALVPTILSTVHEERYVSFYSGRNTKREGLVRAPSKFSGALCLAITSAGAVTLPWLYREWLRKHPEHFDALDLAIGDLLAPGLIYYPSQAQHRSLKSTLGARSTHRTSPTFQRAYGEIDD